MEHVKLDISRNPAQNFAKYLLVNVALVALFAGATSVALAQPVVTPGGVVNLASFTSPVVPGGGASIFGSNLAGSTASSGGAQPTPKALAGTSVNLGGFPAPVTYVSPSVVNIQIPWELAGQLQANLTLTTAAGTSSPVAVSLAPFAPALFSQSGNGLGQGLILDFDNTFNSSTNPTVPGGTVQIIANDLGAVTNQPADGTEPTAPANTITPVSVTIGGLPAVVTASQLCGPPEFCFIGPNPGIDSSYQVTVLVPEKVTVGPAVPVVMTMGGVSSNTVTMAVAYPPLTSVAILLPAGLTVGLGGSAPFPVTLVAPAPAGGIFVTLSSSDPTKVTLTPSGLLIPAGATVGSVTPNVNGIAFGSSTIGASAGGYPTSTQVVHAADTISLSPATLTVPSATTGHLFLFLSASAPPSGLTINLSSSTPTIATVPPTVTIPPNSNVASVPVTGVGTGTAVIHASGLPSVADTTASVTVTAGTPASVTATVGTPQSTPINTAFSPLVVTVKDGGGNPLSGITVTFTAPPTSGASGTFAGGANTAITNSSGVATSAAFTADGFQGPFTLTASVAGVANPANFSLTNIVAFATITATAGTPQSVPINMAFAPLVATVKDAKGNPMAGVVVTFSAPASGASGTIAGINTAMTDASGVATSAAFTANSIAGTYSVTAKALGVPGAATFSLANLAGTPFSVTAVSGTPQSAGTNTVFSSPLVALVKDSGGNPVPNATVTFTPPASGASGTFAKGVNTAVANASGVATAAAFTANGTIGSYTVTATSGNASPAAFSLTNTMGIQLPSGVIAGLGSTTLFPVTLGSPAPPNGVFITLTSSNPSVVGLTSSTIMIPAGQTTPVSQTRLVGVAFGTATITATAVGFPSVSQTVQTTDVLTFSPATGTVTQGNTTILFLNLSVPAPPSGLTVNLSSSNQTIATVPATVTFQPNSTSASVRVTGLSPGPVTIHASDLPNIADTTASVTVN